MSRFMYIFADEMTRMNPLSLEKLSSLVSETVSSHALVTVALALAFGVLATAIMARFENNIWAKLAAESLALAMALSPALLPFKAVRFGMGLYLFASFLVVHSRILAKHHGQAQEPTLLQHLYSTFSANLRPRLGNATVRLPSVARVCYTAAEVLLIDGTLYLMQEAIPVYIRPGNRAAAVSLVGGVWVLLAMDLFYSNLIIGLQLAGCPVPTYMRHRHPLLSTSLAEFWGTRWNPVICRLLQDAFYKPLRSVGLPRIACVVGCFAGSALLHAWPQYASTQSLSDAAMMFLFFFGQGCLLTVELVVTTLLTPQRTQTQTQKQTQKHSSSGRDESYTRANFQWLVEPIVVSGLLSVFYIALEGSLPSLPSSLAVAAICCTVLASVLLFHFEVVGFALFASPWPALRALLGWVWAVGSVVAMLPLFSVPVVNALGTLYDRSYFVGPLLRALHRTHQEGRSPLLTAVVDTAHVCYSVYNASVSST